MGHSLSTSKLKWVLTSNHGYNPPMVVGLLSGFRVLLDQMDGSLGFAGETGTKKGNLAFVSLYVFDPNPVFVDFAFEAEGNIDVEDFFQPLYLPLGIWGPKSVEHMGSIHPSKVCSGEGPRLPSRARRRCERGRQAAAVWPLK